MPRSCFSSLILCLCALCLLTTPVLASERALLGVKWGDSVQQVQAYWQKSPNTKLEYREEKVGSSLSVTKVASLHTVFFFYFFNSQGQLCSCTIMELGQPSNVIKPLLYHIVSSGFYAVSQVGDDLCFENNLTKGCTLSEQQLILHSQQVSPD